MKNLALLTALWICLVLGCSSSRPSTPRPQFNAEHRDAIQKALKAKGYPEPDLDISDTDFLVATFELKRLPKQSLRSYAEDALMTIRNTMLPYRVVDKYRVTLNGPSPGPGMIRRYGSARFIEGDRVTWEEAK